MGTSEVNDASSRQHALIRMQWGVRIALRDGVHLNATLYLPREQKAPSAAIVTLTPYVGQTYHDQGKYFAAHGYPFLLSMFVAAAIGREFRPLIQEADDGYDVVEWLARQPYCNGQVAMWGGSYAGYDQWATASRRPPISPRSSGGLCLHRRRYSASQQHRIHLHHAVVAIVSGRTLQDRIFWNNESFWRGLCRQWLESGTPFNALDAFVGNPSPSSRNGQHTRSMMITGTATTRPPRTLQDRTANPDHHGHLRLR